MSLEINFWKRASQPRKDGTFPIYLSLNLNGKKSQMTTGISVKEREWNKRAQKVKKSNKLAEVHNESLEALKVKALKKYNELQQSGEAFSVFDLRDAILDKDNECETILATFDAHLDKMIRLVNRGYTKATVVKYNQTRERLREFIKSNYRKEDLPLSKLSYNFMSRFEEFLKIKYNNSGTTRYKHFQRIKTVSNEAIRNGKLNGDPFNGYRIKQTKKPLVYLTLAELQRIEEKHIENPRLKKIQLLFLFSCYSGLAYKETFNLTPTNYIEEDGASWIHIVRQKTGRPFRIVLLPQAVKYLNMIREEFQHEIPHNKLLPQISNQKFNDFLKEIASLCRINKKLTTHVARKTFSTGIALRAKVSVELLSALLGHSNIAVTTSYYTKITDEIMLNGVNDLAKQLEQLKSQ